MPCDALIFTTISPLVSVFHAPVPLLDAPCIDSSMGLPQPYVPHCGTGGVVVMAVIAKCKESAQ
jgi:hypothetical protein